MDRTRKMFGIYKLGDERSKTNNRKDIKEF